MVVPTWIWLHKNKDTFSIEAIWISASGILDSRLGLDGAGIETST